MDLGYICNQLVEKGVSEEELWKTATQETDVAFFTRPGTKANILEGIISHVVFPIIVGAGAGWLIGYLFNGESHTANYVCSVIGLFIAGEASCINMEEDASYEYESMFRILKDRYPQPMKELGYIK